jgi:hypothetical protein
MGRSGDGKGDEERIYDYIIGADIGEYDGREWLDEAASGRGR